MNKAVINRCNFVDGVLVPERKGECCYLKKVDKGADHCEMVTA